MLRIGTRSNRCLSNTQPLKVKVLQVLAIHDEIAGLPVENVHHVGGDVHAHSALCFNRRRADVRRTVKVFHLKKRDTWVQLENKASTVLWSRVPWALAILGGRYGS